MSYAYPGHFTTPGWGVNEDIDEPTVAEADAELDAFLDGAEAMCLCGHLRDFHHSDGCSLCPCQAFGEAP